MTREQAATALVQNLARLTGLDASAYEAQVLPSGTVRVSDTHRCAYYRAAGWVSQFVKDLYRGRFREGVNGSADTNDGIPATPTLFRRTKDPDRLRRLQ